MTFVARGDEEKLFRRIKENIGTSTEALPGEKFISITTMCCLVAFKKKKK